MTDGDPRWRFTNTGQFLSLIRGETVVWDAERGDEDDWPSADDQAAILTALNNHDPLLEALQNLQQLLDDAFRGDPCSDQYRRVMNAARKAIAAAEAEA